MGASIRFSASRSLKRSGARTPANSSQVTGIATGAPGPARKDQLATAVAPRPLRSQSMKMRPSRLALLMVAT
jgi:hypothetical protein